MTERSPTNRSAAASLRSKIASVLLCAAACIPFVADALPVVPNLAGFGVETPAGRGGTVYKVTNTNASGAGSLKACVDAQGPRVCVFEVSGTINAGADLIIRNPYITIAGQTAPSPGILWRGGALWVQASDVLVQHMRFRAGDSASGPAPDNRDALKIDAPATAPIKNIVLDHCSFGWAIDETASIWGGWDNVTLSNNIFSEGLHESIHSQGPQGYGIIIGPWKGKISMNGNLLAHMAARNPLSRATNMIFVNNVVYNRKYMDVDLQGDASLVNYSSVVGNMFIRGVDFSRASNKPVLLRSGSTTSIASGSKIYVADNYATERVEGDEWSVVSSSNGLTANTIDSGLKTVTPPVWPAGLTPQSANGDAMLNHVLRFSGARPADRDSVDRRVVQQVRDRTGHIINCVAADGSARCAKNAGGWPILAQNRRVLTVPADPHAVTASGYTNLEMWLHKMSAEVEGRQQPAKAPILTSAQGAL